MKWLLSFALMVCFANSCSSQKTQPELALKTSHPAETPSQTAAPTRQWKYIDVPEDALLKTSIKRVYPTCPPQVRCAGKVKVLIAIRADEGVVTEAIARDVHPLLRESVEMAARAWRFKPSNDIDFVLVRGGLVFDLGGTGKTK